MATLSTCYNDELRRRFSYMFENFLLKYDVVISRDGRFGSKVGQIGPQIGQIRDFFRSDFSTFGTGEPNALKSDLKKPRFCPIWGPI